nr:enoyl-CoA hydratase/isomerase family protein [Streptomyces californicus]
MSEELVRVRVEGRTGVLTLNRPKALNALTHSMVATIAAALDRWERDPEVAAVVLTGAGERGLCAGGDIRSIHEDARAGGQASAAFWRDEYRLNARIARYPKPYVAIMDGIVMGGGVGVAAHGSVRIVTEGSKVAMPETGIGFVPDVGGTYLLALAPGELGTHLALTGAVMGPGDALLCGFADHFVERAQLPALLAALRTAPPGEVLHRHVRDAPSGGLRANRSWIDAVPAAGEAAATLLARSPTALKVTLAALRRARELGPLERVLEQEYRVSCAALSSTDLVEGIRAQVIDKDRAPRWSPGTLAEVTDADVARYFAPTGGEGLSLAASASSKEVPW